MKNKFLLAFLGICLGAAPHLNAQTGFLESNPVAPSSGFFQLESPPKTNVSSCADEIDPLEPFNRGIFWINSGIDFILIEPLAMLYTEIFPEYVRERVGYVLRNLGEPVVFVNNLLQGELEDARITLGRFFFNSTFGLVGIFDVSTDWGLPYKKTDLGLTFASWGIESGPYLILPVLGPSSVRDAWGRLGDFTIDPVNMWSYGLHSNTRTSVQVLDAKTSNIDFLDNLKKHSVDYYAAIRSWYIERRRNLLMKECEKEATDTPKPDDESDL